MQEIILIAHLSLDGFVAAENGDLSLFKPGDENLEFVTAISKATDTILMGRNTFNLLDEYWTGAKDLVTASKAQIEYSNWYNSSGKVVISKTIPEPTNTKTSIIRDNIVNSILGLKEKEGTGIVIFASPLLTQLLMQHKLIDTFWLFLNPVFFGKGIKLFKDSPVDSNYKLCESKSFANGEVALKYIKTT